MVTGANTGIGRVTAEVLAKRGARVRLACRTPERAQPVIDAIRSAGGEAELVQMDLADFASVRAGADAILARDEPLHLLINNAGLGGAHGLTKDGFELTFGTNHLGHFLLTMLLMKRIRASAPARIVNVASTGHYRAKTIDFDAQRRPTASSTGLPEYFVSKLANVLFTKELARRIAGNGVHNYSLHPGAIASDVWRHVVWPIRPLLTMFMKSNEEGAKTTLYCATSPEVAEHDGRYYDDCREKKPNPVSEDLALAGRLWEKSAEWTGADLVT